MSGLRNPGRPAHEVFAGERFFRPPLRSSVSIIGSEPEMVLCFLFSAQELAEGFSRYSGRVRQTTRGPRIGTLERRRIPTRVIAVTGNHSYFEGNPAAISVHKRRRCDATDGTAQYPHHAGIAILRYAIISTAHFCLYEPASQRRPARLLRQLRLGKTSRAFQERNKALESQRFGSRQ